jgi:hypothetical protein
MEHLVHDNENNLYNVPPPVSVTRGPQNTWLLGSPKKSKKATPSADS